MNVMYFLAEVLSKQCEKNVEVPRGIHPLNEMKGSGVCTSKYRMIKFNDELIVEEDPT